MRRGTRSLGGRKTSSTIASIVIIIIGGMRGMRRAGIRWGRRGDEVAGGVLSLC